jgi:2-oxoglutarate dehydrogenase complex dehydrogenase (E1) component-like enzyme
MARQDVNEALLETSFLYGANAAYIEELQAAYARNPASVDPEWQAFFKGLGEDETLVEKNAAGASWEKPNWPVPLNGELVWRRRSGTRSSPARPRSRSPASRWTASPPPPASRSSRPPRIPCGRSC